MPQPVTTKIPAVTTTIPAKPIQNSQCSDDLTSDPNKQTMEKGVGKERLVIRCVILCRGCKYPNKWYQSYGSRRRNHITWRRPLREEQRLCVWFVIFYTAVVELTLQVTINNCRRREVKYRQNQEVLVDIPERIIEHGLRTQRLVLNDILNKENKDVNAAATNSSIPFPPGFTPDKPDTDVDELVAQKDQFQPDVKSVGSSSHTVESANNVDDQFSTRSIENIQKKKESGSILEILEEMISVGQTMGFSMEGSIKDMERIIDLKGADDHETKAEKVSDMEIKSLWGNTNFDAIVSQSLANQTRMLIVSVYDPQAVFLKRTLWSYLSSLINRWNGECIILGDFNEVRHKEERWGSTFNVYRARDFNHFITSARLVEVQLEGYSYTWAHPSASKMSKLDRFLVSDGFLSLFPHTSAVCLDRHLSDHRPILLREFNTDYGATLFRLFHSWFDFQGFDDMITQTWNSINLNDSNAMVRFKKKLQALKKVIRLWIGNYKRNQMNRTTEIKIKLKDIDKLLDQLGANDDLLSVRSELLKQYHDIHSVETRESIQKAKIKWAVEGDENSKFFHGMINRKRANLAVKGVMIDGEWVDDPSKVKDEFRDYFASRFCDPGIRHGVINFNFPNRLNIDQSGELEAPISRDEIRRAVWDCGENKSPGPDGFTFEFFRKFWNIVGPDLCLAVEWFFHHASFPVGCNSSFIALIPKTLNPKSVGEYRPISLIGSIYKIVTKILANRLSTVIADIISNVQTAFLPNRQILDGPFIINELLARCHHKKHSAMVFKIDFAKAYDSIRWDYLGDVLKSFGFGVKWCSWIRGILNSSMASILVNGSPTKEFQFHRGLKQGDPLAPYLFIIIMESLHLSFSRVIEAGIFTGIKIDSSIFYYSPPCVCH
ncbi:RNA-directed DNA polymerase, eukaryota [Tanacetum coccineum]|uniref:RNA-directed DNA polymerase, eukaryota n=1 Tax=Tanacetum coccineum TaxID=301880 RepID=A0ABQ5HUZ8_9ASTR